MKTTLLCITAVAALSCEGTIFSSEPVRAVEPTAPPRVVVPAPAQIRLLSSVEYRNTVRDLLGLESSPELSYADRSAGFDNGAGTQVSENLFAALLAEGQRLAVRWTEALPEGAYGCFARADITDACVRTLISQLGRRAYRRPLSPEQADALFGDFVRAAALAESRPLAVEYVVARLLTSPHFLYRTEVGAAQTGTSLRTLDAFEKASLLSYSLTGSMPDEPLLADAEAGLLDEEHVRAQVRRLWSSPATRARVGDLVRHWLKATALDDMVSRPQDFPKLAGPEQGRALKAELDGFVGAVLFDGAGTLPALLGESFTVANRHTAGLYGLSLEGDAPQRLELPPAERKGVLTLASTMAAHSSSGDASKDRPVIRGLMVKTQLLCETVGPPSGVNTVAARNAAMQIPDFEQLTTREQYEAMMQQGDECKACHRQFMPLGFTFGRYDALGRYRTEQRGRTIDPAVSAVPWREETRSFADALELSQALSQSAALRECFTKNLLGYTEGVARTEHIDTFSGALLEHAEPTALHVGRLVESLFADPRLYTRKVVADAPVTGGTGGGSGAGGGAGGGTGAGGAGGAGGGSVALATTVLAPSGTTLAAGGSKVSQDGKYTFIYQLDGNLVLYRTGGGPLWDSKTPGQSRGRTAMQPDGNLVVYDAAGRPVFHTHTDQHPGAYLAIDANGRLSILGTDSRELWSSDKGVTP